MVLQLLLALLLMLPLLLIHNSVRLLLFPFRLLTLPHLSGHRIERLRFHLLFLRVRKKQPYFKFSIETTAAFSFFSSSFSLSLNTSCLGNIHLLYIIAEQG